MITPQSRPAMDGMFFIVLAFTLGGYFTFAAVQGDYGIFRRVQINAEIVKLTAQRKRKHNKKHATHSGP